MDFTPFINFHRDLGAKMHEFAGFECSMFHTWARYG